VNKALINHNMTIFERYQGWINYAIPLALALAALLIRAPGLGKWCFTVDEYYSYKAVTYILEKGIPQFPGGGYYFRGVLVQYLMAFSSYIFPEREFAARVIPLVFGTLSVPLFFLICRYFMPPFPAFLCSLLLLFSSWHIEFSRFARMYAPFQFAFFLFIYFFYSGYFLNNKIHKAASWAVAFMSIFIYEGSIFLPFILLLPILHEESPFNRNTIKIIMLFVLLIGTNYTISRFDRYLNILENPYPSDLIIKNEGINIPIILPELLLLKFIWNSKPLIFGYIMCAIVGVYVFAKHIIEEKNFWGKISVFAAAFLPLLSLYGLLLFILVILIVSRKSLLTVFINGRKYWISYISLITIFWIIAGITMLISQNPGISNYIVNKKIFLMLFNYPRIYEALYLPFSDVIPIWGIILSIALFASVVHYLFTKNTDSRRFIIAVLIICIFLLSVFKTGYYETRYSFFFFPLSFIALYTEIFIINERFINSIRKERQ
jgi:hypothetical protein